MSVNLSIDVALLFIRDVLVKCAVATLIIACFFAVIKSSNDATPGRIQPSSPTVWHNSVIVPQNQAQRAMLAQFRLATEGEYALVHEIDDFDSSSALWHVYVAVNSEITLTQIDTPMVLILPIGHRWVAGPQGNVTILRTQGEALRDILIGGTIFADPMCTLAQLGTLKSHDCYSATANVANAWDEMITHTREATVADLRSWDLAGEPSNYLVAISDLRIAPQYAFDGALDRSGVIAIVVPEGVKVYGGQLGYMDIYLYNKRGTAVGSALDSICFMNGVGTSIPASDPKTFVPTVELQRVKQCKR